VGKRGEILDDARNYFVDAMGDFYHYWTNNKFAGRLYGFLFFQESPMSLDDISQALGTTKTTVSTHIRQLHRQGLAKPAYVPGQPRKDFYQVVPDDYPMAYLERKMEEISASLAIVTRCQDMLRSSEAQLSKEERERARLYIDRLHKIRTYCEMVEQIYLKIKDALENELLHIVLNVETNVKSKAER
jgi:DNA-binding transcriptional regulator GbsR (MarR family)